MVISEKLEARRLLSAAVVGPTPTAMIVGSALEITGTPGNDTISVVSGTDQLIVGINGMPDQPFSLDGLKSITVLGGAGDDVISIGSDITLAATLKGNGGNDSLVAGGGISVLIGANGNDTLDGGGDTSLLFPGGFAQISSVPTGNDLLAGGSGQSIAEFTNRSDNLVLSNDGLPDSGDVAAGEAVTIMPSVDAIVGGSGSDTITGTTEGDALTGGAGKDLLVGSAAGGNVLAGGKGNDTIVSNSTVGNDKLIGDQGNNILLLSSDTSQDVIQGGSDIGATIKGLNFSEYVPNTSPQKIFQLIDPPPAPATPAVKSIASDSATAAPLVSSTVTAQVVGTVLTITGTAASDSIEVSSDGTNFNIAANGAELPGVAIAGLTGVSVSGLGGNDTLRADPSVTILTTLSGGGGNDSIAAGGGDTALIGGAGSDTLVGGAGANALVPGNYQTYSNVPTGNDSLVGGTGLNIADFSYRTDGLHLSNDGKPDSGDTSLGETTTISTNISVIFGGTANDTITGTTGHEFLSGGYGADSITGGGANDRIFGGKGKDTVHVAAEPVALFLRDGKADDYSGVTDPTADVLELDLGLDSLLAS